DKSYAPTTAISPAPAASLQQQDSARDPPLEPPSAPHHPQPGPQMRAAIFLPPAAVSMSARRRTAALIVVRTTMPRFRLPEPFSWYAIRRSRVCQVTALTGSERLRPQRKRYATFISQCRDAQLLR